MMPHDEWRGCYVSGWKGLIVPEAFAHPAKFSRALIHRIYAHALEQSWLRTGDTVLDPFGGVGLGALDAMWHGLTWVGVELELRFVVLAAQNIVLWRRQYGHMNVWGSASIIQGDSRRLVEVVAGADCCIGSPPFVSIIAQQDHAFKMPHDSTGNINVDYGSTPGQLGAMKEGDVAAVIGSPPFMAQQRGAGLAKPDAVYGPDGSRFGRNQGYQN